MTIKDITPISYRNMGYEPYPQQMVPGPFSYVQAPTPDGGPSPGDIINAILDVQRNPNKFSQKEIERAREYSFQLLGKDLEFEDDAVRMIKNAAFELADTAAFGLIPDKIGPNKLTESDEIAGMIGSLGAFLFNPISPVATGSKIATRVLPSIAKGFNFAGKVDKTADAATAVSKATNIAKEGAGKVAEWLGTTQAAARIGSAIGGGFNFEDGINPIGLIAGTMWPYMKGPKSKATATGNPLGNADDAISFIRKQKDTPLGKAIYNRYVSGGVVNPNEYSLMAKQFGVAESEVRGIDEVIRKLVKGPHRQLPIEPYYAASAREADDIARYSELARAKQLEEVQKATQRQLPGSVVELARNPAMTGTPPVNMMGPSVVPVIPPVPAINPIVQAGKATLAVTPEIRSIVKGYGANVESMTDEQILNLYNRLLKVMEMI